MLRLPAALQQQWQQEPEWLARLPTLVGACVEQWSLVLEPPIATPYSLVIPAGDVVLKLNAPSHYEADHEAAALQTWEGHGAVRLIAHNDARRALLLERCLPGTRLSDSATNRHAVVADLLPKLAVQPAASHPFRSMADEATRWIEEVPQAYSAGGRPFERRLLEFALDVFRSVDGGATALVNQDLHEENILRARREPWLVIDPKPAIGEPEVNAVGLLRNGALSGGSRAVKRWLDLLEQLGYDRQRALAWGVAHALAWGWDADGHWSPRSIQAARTIAESG